MKAWFVFKLKNGTNVGVWANRLSEAINLMTKSGYNIEDFDFLGINYGKRKSIGPKIDIELSTGMTALDHIISAGCVDMLVGLRYYK